MPQSNAEPDKPRQMCGLIVMMSNVKLDVYTGALIAGY